MAKRAAKPSPGEDGANPATKKVVAVDGPEAAGTAKPPGSTGTPIFRASFFQSSTPRPMPEGFVLGVQALEKLLGMPVWLCIHNGRDLNVAEPPPCSIMDSTLRMSLAHTVKTQPRGKKFAVLVHSPGGFSKSAYQAASILRRHCGGFTAVVPSYAKSAATLFCLGADELMLGEHAELGPLDVQVYDTDRDAMRSALDEVQALERLQAFALEAIDTSMFVLIDRSGKSLDKLLPLALNFSMDMVRPLIEKIDTVHFTQASRQLKEAEEYAVRLLNPRFSDNDARRIASHLVEKYPEHGFVIDTREAERVGLKLKKPSKEIREVLEVLSDTMPEANALGFLEEVKP
jgi:hypothetical protein